MAATNGATRTVDFDAIIGEVSGTPITLTYGGKEFTLPAELPFAFIAYMADGELLKGVRALFGEQTEAFLELNPPMDVIDKLPSVYEVDPGEAAASSSS